MVDGGGVHISQPHLRRRRMEIFAFLLLTVVLMPTLAVVTVGTYGLSVWIFQTIVGPPGPPPQR
jgi:nitrate reductase NapE